MRKFMKDVAEIISFQPSKAWQLASLTAALNKLLIRSNFLSPVPSILYTHVQDCTCGLCTTTTKKIGQVWLQIRNTQTRLCLS
jgi:hypothetical protein